MILPVIAYPVINPVAIKLGLLSVRWYGLAYLAGFVVAGLFPVASSKGWPLPVPWLMSPCF